jgi:hypothetical protein
MRLLYSLLFPPSCWSYLTHSPLCLSFPYLVSGSLQGVLISPPPQSNTSSVASKHHVIAWFQDNVWVIELPFSVLIIIIICIHAASLLSPELYIIYIYVTCRLLSLSFPCYPLMLTSGYISICIHWNPAMHDGTVGTTACSVSLLPPASYIFKPQYTWSVLD